MKEIEQLILFDVPADWEKEWQGMPEFAREDNMPFQKITVHFKTREDVDSFKKIIGQPITYKTDTIWFPRQKTTKGIYCDES